MRLKKLCLSIDVAEAEDEKFSVVDTVEFRPERLDFRGHSKKGLLNSAPTQSFLRIGYNSVVKIISTRLKWILRNNIMLLIPRMSSSM